MEISGISASALAGGSQSATVANAGQAKGHLELPPSDHEHGQRRGQRHENHSSGRALGAFHQELRASLSFAFKARFAMLQQAYSGIQENVSSDDVAADALQTAKLLTAESPTTAAKSLVSLKAKVHEAARYVQETVGGDELGKVDDAVVKVDAGIAELEQDVANSRMSTASVLDVDTRTKQRSTIQIRTQEGDIVKLSLRRMDSMSATDMMQSDGENTSTLTEVSVSSRSRMMLKVDGDLNDSELAAIQNVFAQAEQIANEFFGGDLQAAFASAEGFEFDTEQLARVNMRFRMQQYTETTYRETTSIPRIVADPQPVAAEPVPGLDAELTPPAAEAAPALEDAIPAPVVADAVEESESLVNDGFSSFIESVSNFLRAVGEGFTDQSGSQSVRLHYSESIKLEFLKAVFHAVAPEESETAAANAESVIDRMLEVTAE